MSVTPVPTTALYEDSLLVVYEWVDLYAHATIPDKAKREAWMTSQFDLPKRLAIAAALLRRGIKPGAKR